MKSRHDTFQYVNKKGADNIACEPRKTNFHVSRPKFELLQ